MYFLECQSVVDVHTKLSAEKNELVLALQSGGSAVQVTEKTILFQNLKTNALFIGNH